MRFALSLAAAFALAAATCADDPKATAALPRRVFFVHVSDYLYFSPLTHAAPGGPDRTRQTATQLAAALRVPTAAGNDQLFVLSDTDKSDAHFVTKGVLAKGLDGFCSTTREQDRVVIYLGVHAIEREGKAFVAPADGDPLAPDSLLPVSEVYAKLKELKASQKVVIWDVCRADPERVHSLRHPGPMTPALFRALTSVPDGVQVLVSCSPGEHALEYSASRGTAAPFAGSAYLDAVRRAATDHNDAMKAAPDDPIPAEALHGGASKLVAEVAKARGVKQTPAVAGTAGPPARFDPKEQPAKRFSLPAPPKGAPEVVVKGVFEELAVPPLLDDQPAQLARLPFPEAALKNYAPDVTLDEMFKNAGKYPMRLATLRALQTVREVWPLGSQGHKLPDTIRAPINDQAKRAVNSAQESLALAIVRLELELENLNAVANERAKETKRWQAHYDLALAELRLRVVVLHEYNRTLAQVKTETLPDLPADATGWRLLPTAKVEGRRDVQKLLASANAGFAQVTTDHKGTPWEVLAKRSLATLPSAHWEVVVSPKNK